MNDNFSKKEKEKLGKFMKKLNKELKKIKGMSELERIRYYRKHNICDYFQLCPWKYISLLNCHKKKGIHFEDCLQRLDFLYNEGKL